MIDLQAYCEEGQSLLNQTRYLHAEAALAYAEREAWAARDCDTLARLYMPLQEARRQKRQRCGEGIVCLDLIAEGPDDHLDGRHVVENFPHGQLLVAGWGTIEPALRVRELAAEHELYLETFLGAVFPTDAGVVVAIIPEAPATLPTPAPMARQQLADLLPPHSIMLDADDLPQGARKGDAASFGHVSSLWERLHLPFLRKADAAADLMERIEGYRRTIRVDYACELAHQKLSDAARSACRPMTATTEQAYR